jgi:hypothetical protein
VGSFRAVPSGHRLVIQHLSGKVSNAGGLTFADVVLGEPGPILTFESIFPGTISSGNNNVALFDQPVLLYYDAGKQPLAVINFTGTPGSASSNLLITGYLLDCNLAPCAPIAQ